MTNVCVYDGICGNVLSFPEQKIFGKEFKLGATFDTNTFNDSEVMRYFADFGKKLRVVSKDELKNYGDPSQEKAGFNDGKYAFVKSDLDDANFLVTAAHEDGHFYTWDQLEATKAGTNNLRKIMAYMDKNKVNAFKLCNRVYDKEMVLNALESSLNIEDYFRGVKNAA